MLVRARKRDSPPAPQQALIPTVNIAPNATHGVVRRGDGHASHPRRMVGALLGRHALAATTACAGRIALSDGKFSRKHGCRQNGAKDRFTRHIERLLAESLPASSNLGCSLGVGKPIRIHASKVASSVRERTQTKLRTVCGDARMRCGPFSNMDR